MKKIKFAGSVFLICIIILSVWGSAVNIEAEAEPAAKSTTNGLTPREPIYMDGNEDFSAQAASEGWAGDGTEVSPYVIEDYDINANSANGIEIRNMNVYFVIKNCVVRDGMDNKKHGIYFYNVIHATICGVTSYNNKYGIWLSASSNNNITNCSFYNNHDGILLDYASNNNRITSCAVYNSNGDGIYLLGSSNNNIANCSVHNNVLEGIELDSSSNNNITNCAAYNNSCGIEVSMSSKNNNITNCSFYNNIFDGVKLVKYANNNQITNCEVYNNLAGIRVWWHSSYNEIHYCNIYDNTCYGVEANRSTVNTTYNWWGSGSGPYHPDTNPNGTGDNVSDNVLYDPWLTEPVEGVGWTPPEGEEEGAPEKEEKPPEGFNILYILGIVAAVAAGIIVAVFLLRRRFAIPKPETPAPKPELIPPQVPTLTLRCPQCKSTFKVESKEKPFKVKCPSCGKEGVIR